MMSFASIDLARAHHDAFLAEAVQGRRASQAAAARRLRRRAERLSQRAARVSRRAEQATARARPRVASVR